MSKKHQSQEEPTEFIEIPEIPDSNNPKNAVIAYYRDILCIRYQMDTLEAIEMLEKLFERLDSFEFDKST